MLNYIIRRILIMFPTLLAITFIVLGIMELTPSSPALSMIGYDASPEQIEQLNHELGYDRPFLVRYVDYVLGLFKGDMGVSYRNGRPVFDEIMQRFPTTLKLAAIAIPLALITGIPLGIMSAVKQYSIFDFIGTIIAMFMASMPGFWLGLMLILLFSLKLGWLPSYGIETWKHFILPSVTLAIPSTAAFLRLTRTTMLESIRQDYIRTARAKGQTEQVVILNHAARNALLPVITYAGMEMGVLIGGIVTIEMVFSINGVGNMLLTAIRTKDILLVTGCAIFLAFSFMVVLLVVDILFAFIDPRIKAKYIKE